MFVGIHIRRGDYAYKKQLEYGRKLPTLKYLYTAMDFFTKSHHSVCFIMASDDKKWCKEHFQNRTDVWISNSTRAELDFALLVQCNHTIITTGMYYAQHNLEQNILSRTTSPVNSLGFFGIP